MWNEGKREIVLTNIEKTKVSIIENKLQDLENLLNKKENHLDEVYSQINHTNCFLESLLKARENIKVCPIISISEYRSLKIDISNTYDLLIRKNNECIFLQKEIESITKEHILLEKELNYILTSSISKVLEFSNGRRFKKENQ